MGTNPLNVLLNNVEYKGVQSLTIIVHHLSQKS